MKILALSAAAAAALALTASPTLAKVRNQPADDAHFGQFEVASEAYMVSESARLEDGDKGIDGDFVSDYARLGGDSAREDHPVFTPPPEKADNSNTSTTQPPQK